MTLRRISVTGVNFEAFRRTNRLLSLSLMIRMLKSCRKIFDSSIMLSLEIMSRLQTQVSAVVAPVIIQKCASMQAVYAWQTLTRLNLATKITYSGPRLRSISHPRKSMHTMLAEAKLVFCGPSSMRPKYRYTNVIKVAAVQRIAQTG